ncbi:T9SS type A sorting domain-containing protein [Aquimarina litoralis]|uniref:T9SS type A sorting domain-containing protein n=1 Tax=Aquimarina litoralis TaxID=584605 RepID=UPI001C58B279|nr:heparin lyase I family protein [Aquimarina litoralis]MBW1296209.1 T9SS type A sorting domain-containing protein [Aquimarina litoralis]
MKTKDLHKIWKYSVFILFLFAINSIKAQVLWYGDPDKSVNSSFRRFDSGNAGDDCNNQSNNNSFASTVNDSEYGKVWRIRKPIGQKRGEFARTTGTINNYEPEEGDLVYYGWRWKIESTPDITSGIAVWQWKTDAGGQNNTQNYPLNMGYGNGRLSFSAWGPCYPNWNSCSGSISKRKTTLWSKSIPENTWVSFVVGIKMSRNDEIGYVELWYNGQKQTLSNADFQDYQVDISSDGKRAYHKTFDGKVVYPKWGSYNSNACNYNTTTYYDEMRIATTLESAMPSGSDSGENQLPVISFNDPTTQTVTVDEGHNLMVNVDASDPDGNIDNVKLYMDNVEIREEVNSPYEWGHRDDLDDELKNLVAGTYEIKAVATDNRGGTSEISFTLVVEDTVLSTPDFAREKPMTVYPIPVVDFLTVETPKAEISNVSIYDLQGKELVEATIDRESKEKFSLDFSMFSKGVYFLKAQFKDADIETIKVVKK